MAKPRIKTGISSILFYRGLRDKDAENMLNGNGFTPTSTDPRTNSYEYENSRYEGIVLTVDKINGSPWILYVNVATTEVLQ